MRSQKLWKKSPNRREGGAKTKRRFGSCLL
jgi:hypothetical protein